MGFVIDASITASWALQDEAHPLAAEALDRLRNEEALAPALWWFEVRNVLIVNERRGRISQTDCTDFLRMLSRLPITLDRDPAEGEVMSLARARRLSVYDAAYLELAVRSDAPLATLDERLARACEAAGVGLL